MKEPEILTIQASHKLILFSSELNQLDYISIVVILEGFSAG